jgi:hypothetical protein
MYPELEDMAPAPAQDIDQIKKHKKIAIWKLPVLQ